jgi:hypothetical protein
MTDERVHTATTRSGRHRIAPPAELRAVAQGGKVGADQRWSYVLFRRSSIYLTWLFLHTGLSPNQITVLSLLTALLGFFVLALGSGPTFVIGLVLLLLYHLLDRVDGEVARVRSRFSLLGIYMDNSGHHLTSAFVFIAAGIAIASESDLVLGGPAILVVGAIGGVAASHSRIAKNAPFQLFSQYVMSDPTLLDTVDQRSDPLNRDATKASRRTDGTSAPRSPIQLARDLLLTSTQFTAILTMFFVGWLVAETSGEIVALEAAFVVCAALQLAGWLGAEAINLKSNLGNEVHRLSQVTRP